jgi:hypothetical protein
MGSSFSRARRRISYSCRRSESSAHGTRIYTVGTGCYSFTLELRLSVSWPLQLPLTGISSHRRRSCSTLLKPDLEAKAFRSLNSSVACCSLRSPFSTLHVSACSSLPMHVCCAAAPAVVQSHQALRWLPRVRSANVHDARRQAVCNFRA